MMIHDDDGDEDVVMMMRLCDVSPRERSKVSEKPNASYEWRGRIASFEITNSN